MIDVEAVNNYLETVMGAPFQWGRTDCVTVVFMCVGAAIGWDAESELSGRWYSLLSAKRHAKKVGGVQEQRSHLALHGYKKMNQPMFAHDGDVCLNFQLDPRLDLPDCAFVFGGKFITANMSQGVIAARFDASLISEHWGRP